MAGAGMTNLMGQQSAALYGQAGSFAQAGMGMIGTGGQMYIAGQN